MLLDELTKLESDGILRKEPRGNRVYYSLRPDHTFYGDIISIVAKTTGLGKSLIEDKNKIGKVSFIMFSRICKKKGQKARGRC